MNDRFKCTEENHHVVQIFPHEKREDRWYVKGRIHTVHFLGVSTAETKHSFAEIFSYQMAPVVHCKSRPERHLFPGEYPLPRVRESNEPFQLSAFPSFISDSTEKVR